jgi:hypothetical protein
MAGEGPPSTTGLISRRKVVDADLRRHDDAGAVRVSLFKAVGIKGETPRSRLCLPSLPQIGCRQQTLLHLLIVLCGADDAGILLH